MTTNPPSISVRPDVRSLLQRPGRVVLVAPHPDDEVLALGGSLAMLARSGREVLVVAVTDGDASHPRSTEYPEDRLCEVRQAESRRAMDHLHPNAQLVRLGLKDGQVVRHEQWLASLLGYLCEGAAALFMPWCDDGHADHEACGRAAKAAAEQAGVPAYEYPVWGLVEGHPAHERLRGRPLTELAVDEEALAAKRIAMRQFVSQLNPDHSTGRPPILPPHALLAWSQPREVVLA